MGRLIQLELENFKSYRGQQVIGPFTSFTAVVGPNGAGKSNLMDAISFVLGVRSAHLRSSQLNDLIYRGRTVESRDGQLTDEAGDQRGRRAWVRAVYEDDNGATITFQRSITAAGDSEYRINGRVVSLHAYNERLESQNILVKAKNFLVFQGDVEAVAAQSPKDLTRLVEQISGSAELQSEYSELEKLQEAAAERSTFAYNKKRAVAAEVQSISDQKKELDLYESKQHLRTKLTVQHMLFKLFVAENRINEIKEDIESLHGGSITQASEQRMQLDASLNSQKKTQAKAYKAVNRQERQIKLVEQKIETRQPALAGLSEKVTYTERRSKQIEENVSSARIDADRQREVVAVLEEERARVSAAESRFEEQLQGSQTQRGTGPSEDTMVEYNRLSEQLRSECVEDMHTRDVQDRQIQLLSEASRRVSDRLDGLQGQLEGVAASERVYVQQQQTAEAGVANTTAELEQAKDVREQANARIYVIAQPIFADFCQRLGIPSLEAFEKQLLPATEAAEERRLQFRTQLSRLDSQLSFEQQQLDEATSKLDKLVKAQQSTAASLESLQAELTREQAEMAGFVAQIEGLRRELAALTTKYGDATEDVHVARHTLEQGQKDLDTMNKDLRARATEMDRALAEKAAVLRKCKIEDIPLPLLRGSLLALPLEAGVGAGSGSQLAESYLSQLSLGDTQSSSMSIDGADDIAPDYSTLPQADRTGAPGTVEQKYIADVARLTAEIDVLNPNPHARERLESARTRLHEIEVEHNAARQEARESKSTFQAVRKRRHDVFMRCYNHLATAIDHAYKALTQSPLFPLGGTAYLALEDPESPYLAGVKYHAMPPLKRFRDMDQLSGGEKTVAALALLFSLQTFRPAPFFVLDEVDAALDLANVAKLANFLRENARSYENEDAEADQADEEADEAMTSHYSLRQSARIKRNAPEEAPTGGSASQFIVISLKQALFERAQSLVGIYRDQAQNSSQVLTLDLDQFAS
ncbi:Structural maintenance of chromosomes protein 1 [Coemansia sp. RSA 1972]|nr:Structural maintenance of chromosomes protein 1 [Coemansia sp. RSA 1972]